jgi:queuine tRNA-ribosyltransferase
MERTSGNFGFRIEKKLGGGLLGRAGVITTPHGTIETPAFIVVGTKATVKSLTPEQVKGLGAEAVLANTYHLYLQPGSELVRDSGGLGKFMHWDGPTFTDSGGFQVFSLGAAFGKGVSKVTSQDAEGESDGRSKADAQNHAQLAKVDDDGVTFKSHIDGSSHRFTPERSLQIQHNIGADIIVAFDECTSPQDPYDVQKHSLDRTHRWAKRSLDEHKRLGGTQALYGVIQGGKFQDLREEAARTIGVMEFDGFGIGGSFNKEDIGTAVRWVNAILPEEKPRHLLGIGEPIDFFLGVENGVDTFDCVSPTRIGRNGALYTKDGRINLHNAKFVTDLAPVEKDCACYTCLNFTRAYLAHLFRSDEMLAATLASIHNLYFIVRLVSRIRRSIIEENFFQFKNDFLTKYYG